MKFVFVVGTGSLSCWLGWLLLFAYCNDKYQRHYVKKLYPEVISAKIVTAEDPRPDGEDEEDAAWRIGKLRLMLGWTPNGSLSVAGPITECQRSMNRGRSTTCIHTKTCNSPGFNRCGLLVQFGEIGPCAGGTRALTQIDGEPCIDMPVSYTDLRGRQVKYPNEDLRFFVEWDNTKWLELDQRNLNNPERIMKGVEVVVENPNNKPHGAELKVTRVQYYGKPKNQRTSGEIRDPLKYK